MQNDLYTSVVDNAANHVFEVMARRISSEADLRRLREAFEFAREAHAPQVRRTGEPYILHPIAVATIAAEELELGVNAVIACFLHDVVEDTDYTLGDICSRFGDDVAFLVRVVTKPQARNCEFSRQLDNYRQLLESVEFDIRAVLVKLADRLHNMRTLESMPADKQMKIAGETDYFYAPLANRLGLYNVKTELENLSFRFRCPDEFDEISARIARHVEANRLNLERFKAQIEQVLHRASISADVRVGFRSPFSLWRKMQKFGDDFNHLKYRHFIEVVFDENQTELSEKSRAMEIYCLLTDRFPEKHTGMTNYIDSPKENGYQSIHVKLLPGFGRWQEIHISSRRMIRQSQLGCIAERTDANLEQWIEKFRHVLREAIKGPKPNERYMDDVVTTFYNDDIQVFTHKGEVVILPQDSTVIDFAYEVGCRPGDHVRYARINGRLESVVTPLRRGDVVEIFTSPDARPDAEWLCHAHTYRARRAIRQFIESRPVGLYRRCQECNPIPGDEVIGIRDHLIPSKITVHRRDCHRAISLASSYGEDVMTVDYAPDDDTLYGVTLTVRAVDRHHLLIDLIDCITNTLNLSMESLTTSTDHAIVTSTIRLGVHSNSELKTIMSHISAIDGVDEVRRPLAASQKAKV